MFILNLISSQHQSRGDLFWNATSTGKRNTRQLRYCATICGLTYVMLLSRHVSISSPTPPLFSTWNTFHHSRSPRLRNPNDLMWTSQGTFNNINRTCHHNSLTECISWNLCINSPRSLTRSTRECHGIASHEKNLSFSSLLPKYVLIRWFRRLIKLSGVELSHTIHHNNPYRRPKQLPRRQIVQIMHPTSSFHRARQTAQPTTTFVDFPNKFVSYRCSHSAAVASLRNLLSSQTLRIDGLFIICRMEISRVFLEYILLFVSPRGNLVWRESK